MQLLEELDERQVRLGYVNCVVLVAGRHLDTRTALRRRFDDLIFRRIYEGTPEASEFLAEIDETGREALDGQDQQRERQSGGSKKARNPLALLTRNEPRGRFRYVSHLWLLQRSMPSHLGPLAPERSEVFLEHTKHLGLLAETYALTEMGSVLKHLLLDCEPTIANGRATPNPLFVGRRLGIRALYTWALLENDVLTPFLLREFVSRRQVDPALLSNAVKKLVESFERGARVDSAREMKALRAYETRVGKATDDSQPPRQPPRRGRGERKKEPPGFKIHRHHVRPRLEHYVDIGILSRRAAAHAGESVYEPSAETVRALESWRPLLEDPKTIRRFLDTRFFQSAAKVFGLAKPAPCNQWEALMYFAKAFALVGREIGFTSGRTVAFAGCLLALEEGRLAEIDTMFDAVYSSAKSDLGAHLVFSGGSRFDREFLIRVKPEITPILRDRIAAANVPSEAK